MRPTHKILQALLQRKAWEAAWDTDANGAWLWEVLLDRRAKWPHMALEPYRQFNAAIERAQFEIWFASIEDGKAPEFAKYTWDMQQRRDYLRKDMRREDWEAQTAFMPSRPQGYELN